MDIKDLKNRVLPNEFKFKTFGDAYIIMQEVFFLGNSKNYVTYGDLLDIIKKENLEYQVGINGEFRDPTPLAKELLENYGWNESGDIRIDKPLKCMYDPLYDSNVLYMPEVKILNIKKED